MKTIGKIGLAIVLSGLLAGSAWADRRHHHHPRSSVHFGIHLGSPWLFPPYPRFPPPYYPYWPHVPVVPVVVSPPPPPVYIEQRPLPQAAVPTLESGYWYYCVEAGGYYPQVSVCPGDWRKVAPRSSE